jgi:hypothetical protein
LPVSPSQVLPLPVLQLPVLTPLVPPVLQLPGQQQRVLRWLPLRHRY